MRITVKTCILFGFMILAGCTLHAKVPKDIEQPNAVYTYAAQTIVAKSTSEAPDNLIVRETPSNPQPAEETHIAVVETVTKITESTQVNTQTLTTEATIAYTPTNTPLASPTPIVIWEDDFSNNTLWWTEDGNKYGFKYQEGGYVIYNNLLNAAIWSLGYLGLEDVWIEVDVARLDGPDDGYSGVFCRHANDGEDYYALVIADNGFYGILKMEDNEKDFIEFGIDENDIIYQGLGKTNRVRGICHGESLILYVNGKKLLEVTDDKHTTGGVGVIAGNQLSGIGVEILFDNFLVIEP